MEHSRAHCLLLTSARHRSMVQFWWPLTSFTKYYFRVVILFFSLTNVKVCIWDTCCSLLSVEKLLVTVEQRSRTSLNVGFNRVYLLSVYSFRQLVGVYLVWWYSSLTSSCFWCAHVYNNVNTPSCQRLHIIPVTRNVICFNKHYPLSYFFFFVK